MNQQCVRVPVQPGPFFEHPIYVRPTVPGGGEEDVRPGRDEGREGLRGGPGRGGHVGADARRVRLVRPRPEQPQLRCGLDARRVGERAGR